MRRRRSAIAMLVTAAQRHHNEITPVARSAAKATTAIKFTPPWITATRSDDRRRAPHVATTYKNCDQAPKPQRGRIVEMVATVDDDNRRRDYGEHQHDCHHDAEAQQGRHQRAPLLISLEMANRIRNRPGNDPERDDQVEPCCASRQPKVTHHLPNPTTPAPRSADATRKG